MLALLLPTASFGALQYVGNVQTTSISANRVDFVLDQGVVARVEILNDDLVRVRVSTTGAFTTHTSGAVESTGLKPPVATISDSSSATFIVTSRAEIAILKAPFQVLFYRADGSLVSADLPQAIAWDASSGFILDQKYAPANEHYFGLGERGGPVDRRGRKFTMFNVDWAGYGEFTDPLYISIPFFYGLRGGQAYGLFFDNPAIPFFDLDSQNNGVLRFGAYAGEINYYVMVGPEPWRVANTYRRLIGYAPLPPKWTLGYHQSRYGYSSATEILQIAQTFRQLNIPCDALYFDINYMNNLEDFTWDPVNFSSPLTMETQLDALGIKRVNIFEPVVRTDDPIWSYLNGSNFLLTGPNGSPLVNSIWYGDVSWIDFTNPAARSWYKQVLETFLSQGISATWDDLDEPAENFMPEAIYNNGGAPQTDLQARNTYALNETSLSYQAQKELRSGTRPWVLSRSGYAGIEKYAALWSGDTLSTFDSLRVSIEMTASMGLSGQDQFGHDIGGFLGSPSAELFIRWMSFSNLTGLFRDHANAGTVPREPWAYGEPYTTMATNIINQHYRLLPYLYTLMANARQGGTPFITPLFFFFPTDPQTYSQNGEFMLGYSLLVAPVYQEGATAWGVYLPAGSNWIDWNSDLSYAGGQSVTVSAPLGSTPVFVREGTVLPGGPVMPNVGAPVPQEFTVDLYPGPDSSFQLYEDDGTSFDYTKGVYLKTQISKSNIQNGIEVNLTRLEGTWLPPQRAWFLYYHQFSAPPSSVQYNGSPIPPVASEAALASVLSGWYLRTTDNRLIVRVPDSRNPLQITVSL
ncbi:MAG: TIM-barrel domain-containing protein [Candidatus Acidiferrum sp.]